MAWLGTLEERQKCDGLAEQGELNPLSLLEDSVCSAGSGVCRCSSCSSS